MITHLSGTIVESSPTQVVIDVQGVGYELLIPSSSFSSLPGPGKSAQIFTHLAIRDDAHILYGFATSEERELFRLLINTVSGIGPRIGLNVLSGMSPRDFKIAVTEGNTKRLSQISGLGKKTAERIVVELKDKVLPAGSAVTASAGASSGATAPPSSPSAYQDALTALLTLGYKATDADKAVRHAAEALGADVSTEELIRKALGR